MKDTILKQNSVKKNRNSTYCHIQLPHTLICDNATHFVQVHHNTPSFDDSPLFETNIESGSVGTVLWTRAWVLPGVLVISFLKECSCDVIGVWAIVRSGFVSCSKTVQKYMRANLGKE